MNVNPQKDRAGFNLIPASLYLGQSWVERSTLSGSVIFVMVIELHNTGIESAIDRIGPEWHQLAKRAKDMGSAAVLLSLLWCAGIWAAAIYAHINAG
jgi:diacylglycerol kinase (ATP)